MKNIIIYDNFEIRENLLPLTFTRPVSQIRVGITTLMEKWQFFFNDDTFSHLTADYLQPKYATQVENDNYFIGGHIVASCELAHYISNLANGEALKIDEEIIAYRGTIEDFKSKNFTSSTDYTGDIIAIRWLYDIFMLNNIVLETDFRNITANRKSQPISDTNIIIGNPSFEDGTPKIFIEEGASIEGVFLNVTKGPIYIGKNCEVMEGSCIRAPFAMCEGSIVNMGTRIYGATTLGPFCKVGGEVNNVVMIGYSNKGHDGFLGNAVIGEWCNLGAGCSASNLKNDYTEIKLWNYPAHRFLRTGLQFCGLIMGDHSKAGVNSIFNTATVIGVGVNIHGTGFPRNFVPSFSEGSSAGFTDVSLVKFFAIAERVMARRNVKLTDTDKEIFHNIFAIADNYK